jgi:hypothetical protein
MLATILGRKEEKKLSKCVREPSVNFKVNMYQNTRKHAGKNQK